MNIDLNAAGNFHGSLNGELRARLMRAISNPCEATWDDAQTIILNPEIGLGLTLWQAVIEIDPDFALVLGPVSSAEGERIRGWERTPSPEIIRQAINYATR